MSRSMGELANEMRATKAWGKLVAIAEVRTSDRAMIHADWCLGLAYILIKGNYHVCLVGE